MAGEAFRNGTARLNRVHSWNGVKFFEGSRLPDQNTLLALASQITAVQLREEKKVWRPEETIEAGQIFFKDGRINIVGPPQSGKGTILFGLSEMCDFMGIGYCFIDGHHQEVAGEVIADTINQAQQKGIPVFFDSTDYLFLKSRGVGRDISSQAQNTRVPIIVSALNEVTVPVAITSHDEEWAGEFLNLALRSKYNTVFSRFSRYEIPLYLQSDASIMRFLKDHNMSPEAASFLVNLAQNYMVTRQLNAIFNEESREILSAIRTYPVLKELVRERAEDLNKILLRALMSFDEQTAKDLGNLILEIEEKRKKLTQLRKANKIRRN